MQLHFGHLGLGASHSPRLVPDGAAQLDQRLQPVASRRTRVTTCRGSTGVQGLPTPHHPERPPHRHRSASRPAGFCLQRRAPPPPPPPPHSAGIAHCEKSHLNVVQGVRQELGSSAQRLLHGQAQALEVALPCAPCRRAHLSAETVTQSSVLNLSKSLLALQRTPCVRVRPSPPPATRRGELFTTFFQVCRGPIRCHLRIAEHQGRCTEGRRWRSTPAGAAAACSQNAGCCCTGC